MAWGWNAAATEGEEGAGRDPDVFVLEWMEAFDRNLWHVVGPMHVMEVSDAAAETPFTKGLGEGEGRLAYARLPMLPESDQVAIRFVDNAVQTVYIDLNGDGALQENEALKPDLANMVVTPVFAVKGGDDEAPRHIRLRLAASGHRIFVSSASAWKGSGTLNGQPLTLVIGDAALSGTPDTFGADLLAIFEAAEAQGYVRPQVLGRTVMHAGVFYEIALTEAGGSWRASFNPLKETGTLQIVVPSGKALRGSILHGSVQQAIEGGATYPLSGAPMAALTLPPGAYRLPMLFMRLEAGDGDEWQAYATMSRQTVVEAGRNTELRLCPPAVRITAVEEDNRRATPDAQISECERGARLFLNARLTSETGTEYPRVMRTREPGPTYPLLRILDPDGREVASRSMEYG